VLFGVRRAADKVESTLRHSGLTLQRKSNPRGSRRGLRGLCKKPVSSPFRALSASDRVGPWRGPCSEDYCWGCFG